MLCEKKCNKSFEFVDYASNKLNDFDNMCINNIITHIHYFFMNNVITDTVITASSCTPIWFFHRYANVTRMVWL